MANFEAGKKFHFITTPSRLRRILHAYNEFLASPKYLSDSLLCTGFLANMPNKMGV